MVSRIAFALVLLGSTAHADKAFTKAKGATTWDCTKDPTVSINHGGGKYTFKGECKVININGGKHALKIEATEALNVNGAKNTITVGTVGSIAVNGAKNKVTWKKAREGEAPTVSNLGTDNAIEKAP